MTITRNWKIISTVILIAVLVTGYLARNRLLATHTATEPPTTVKEPAETTAVPVVVTLAEKRQFSDIIRVQGNLETQNFAMVSPRIPGTIEKLFVDEGDAVIAGKTKLFTIDAVKIERALDIARQNVAVSRCMLLERKANQEKVEADLYKAKLDYNRFEKLLKKEVVTSSDFELQELRFKQANASSKHAKTSVDLAREQVIQAEAVQAIAEKDLKDTIIYAPLTGVVSQRFMEPGEMGDMGKPVLCIEDTSLIDVSAFLPSQHYNQIKLGETKMNITVDDICVNDLTITYKSPTINPKLRTFEIKSTIKNPPDGVVPGALAEIKATFDSRTSMGVPAVSILPRTHGQIVFIIRDGKACEVPVKTGWKNEGWIEILDGDVPAGAPIVSMGQNQLNNGLTVNIQKGEN